MSELTRRRVLTGAAIMAGAAATATPILSARAATPPSGMQAPGYYRYKVGDMEVTAVTDGASRSPLADNYVPNADKAAVNAALEASHMPANTNVTPFTPIVVNTGGKLVVIDTGLGAANHEKSKGAIGQFHTNFAAAGYTTAAVDTVIISHFHPDHFSGMVTADGKKAFPNAEIMVPAGEWAFWMDDAKMNAAPDAMKGLFGLIRKTFAVYDNKVTRYEADKELAPGIRSLASPGHTLGHSSHILASGNDKVLVQADITAGMAFLFAMHPEWHLGFDMDKPLAVATRKKLYDMAIAEKMPVQAYHVAFPALVHVEKAGDGYRLIPVMWNPTL